MVTLSLTNLTRLFVQGSGLMCEHDLLCKAGDDIQSDALLSFIPCRSRGNTLPLPIWLIS